MPRTLVFCAIALLGSLALGSPAFARPQNAPTSRKPAAPVEPTHRVVGGPADLRPAVEAKPIAQIMPGTPVRVLRRLGAEHFRVEVLGSVRIQGVVRQHTVGLRVVRATELEPESGGTKVKLAAGADVRVLSVRRDAALVETVGVVIRGRCPKAALAVTGPEFVYGDPGGPLFRLKRAVMLADPLVPERPLARLETGEEVVGLLEDGVRARIRTYGPIVIEGIVPRDSLGESERKQVTLEPDGAPDHELVEDTDVLSDESHKPIGRVLAGTAVRLEGEEADRARVVTAGDVRLRGLVPKRSLMRLTPAGESDGHGSRHPAGRGPAR